VTAPDQCCKNVKKALAMAPSTRDPKRRLTEKYVAAIARPEKIPDTPSGVHELPIVNLFCRFPVEFSERIL